MFFTTTRNDRTIQIWDLREGKSVQAFKCSLEEVKGVDVIENMLYVYGKASTDSGACNFFDLSMLKYIPIT